MSIDINQVRALNIGCQKVLESLPAQSVFEHHIETAIWHLTKCSNIWDEVRPGDYGQLEFDLQD